LSAVGDRRIAGGVDAVEFALHLLGIDVGKLWKNFPTSIARLVSEACARLGESRTFAPEHVPMIEGTYVGERNAVLSSECIDAVQCLA
jgi:hypothetical protein